MMEENKVIKPRTCQECGKTFPGGPRAWYCPECREKRKKEQLKEYMARKKAGKVIPVGDMIKCEICGEEIVKKSGLQRFCSKCAAIHLKEVDNAQSIEWKRKNLDKIRESKRAMMQKRQQEQGRTSGCVGVSWDKTTHRWKTYMNFKGRQYTLLKTKDKNLAIKTRKEAEEAVENGNFEEWLSVRRKENE